MESVVANPTIEGSWIEKGKHGEIPFEVTEAVPTKKLVTRIASNKLPFGGNWIYEITITSSGTQLTITENGEVYNPFFRFMSKYIFGHHSTIDQYLKSLKRKFGE